MTIDVTVSKLMQTFYILLKVIEYIISLYEILLFMYYKVCSSGFFLMSYILYFTQGNVIEYIISLYEILLFKL